MTTALLLHLDGADNSTVITDSSGTGKTVTAYGNAMLDTAPTLLSGSTAWLALDGTNSYVQTATHSDFNQSGNWTVEAWLRAGSPLQEGVVFYFGDLASDTNKVLLYVEADGKLSFYITQGGSWWGPLSSVAGVVVPNGVPKHVALVKSGSVYYIQYDGVRRNYATMFSTSANIGRLAVGAGRNPAGTLKYYYGHIDEVRYDKSSALYTGATYSIPSVRLSSFGVVDLAGAAVAAAAASAYFVGDVPLAGNAAAAAMASGSLTHGVPLAGSAQAAASATGDLSQGFIIPAALAVSYPAGSVVIPARLDVSANGYAMIPSQLAVVEAGHTPNWSARCLIDGVDVSSRLIGRASVSFGEGAARIASVTLQPAAGVIEPLDYVGKPISLDYVLVIGGVDVPRRLFTGRVDTPFFDPSTTLLTLSCVDDLQNRVAVLPRAVIDGLIGGRYTVAVQGEIDDNWDYAEARLTTVAASLDAGADGGLRVTPWELATTWVTFGESDLLYERASLSLPQRSRLVNSIDIAFDYRYPRLRQRNGSLGWSGTQIDMAPCGYKYPTQQDLLGAAGGSGWAVVSAAFWPAPAAIPHSSGGFIHPDAGSIDMAIIRLAQRHSQTVSEIYTLTVNADESVALNGKLPHALRGALASSFDGNAWESAIDVAPLMASGGEQDYSPDATRADADYAIEALLDQARVKILATHRGARVGNAVLCNPDLDTNKRVAISTAMVSASGKVAGGEHILDFTSGSAITEFELAIFGAGGAGIIAPDTLTPPPPPVAAVETQAWVGEIPPLFVNTYGITPYSVLLMGLLINPPASISVDDVPDIGTKSYPNPFYTAGSYPVQGFRVQMPGVNDADRNPLEKPVAASYSIIVPDDAMIFTIP